MASESVSEIADLLLNRDVNEVYNFDGKNEESIGTIFIPEGYLPKRPRVVNQDIAQEALPISGNMVTKVQKG